MSNLWQSIREKFPPARAVAILTVLCTPAIGIINAWIANHAPLIAEQVGPNQISAIVLGTIAAGVALAYKWLDGRSKWEVSQVSATTALIREDKLLPTAAHGVIESLKPVMGTTGQAAERATAVGHSDQHVEQIAYEAAGAATAPFMQAHPDMVMPDREVRVGVESVLASHGIIPSMPVEPVELDGDALLSQPADIAESDSDPADLELERREREELGGPE